MFALFVWYGLDLDTCVLLWLFSYWCLALIIFSDWMDEDLVAAQCDLPKNRVEAMLGRNSPCGEPKDYWIIWREAFVSGEMMLR